MIKLVTYPSKKEYIYKTKAKAIREIKDNGLKNWEYELIDTTNQTLYKGGLWLTKIEQKRLQSGYTYKEIQLLRRINRRKNEK